MVNTCAGQAKFSARILSPLTTPSLRTSLRRKYKPISVSISSMAICCTTGMMFIRYAFLSSCSQCF